MATPLHPTAKGYVDPGEINLVEHWVKVNPPRWIAGVMAGLFAGVVCLAFAGIVCLVGGMEFLFPVKFWAMILFGSTATEFGMHVAPIIGGFVLFELLAAFLGFAFSHFVFSNSLSSLMAMGLVWGTFSWVFIWNLFLPSFRPVFAAHMPPGPAFPICLVFGLSLTSVAFFHKALGGGSARA